MIFRVIGIALTACVISLTLKSYKNEYGMLISICAGTVIIIIIADYVQEGINYISSLAQSYNLPSDMFSVLLKCLGITMLSKIASDICVDCKETALASKIEICARFAILITAIPIFTGVFNCITAFL